MTMDPRAIPIHPAGGQSRSQAFEYISTKKDELVGWARKFSLFPYPFVTACCGMEYMATACSHYDVDRFGAGLPRFSPRQADEPKNSDPGVPRTQLRHPRPRRVRRDDHPQGHAHT